MARVKYMLVALALLFTGSAGASLTYLLAVSYSVQPKKSLGGSPRIRLARSRAAIPTETAHGFVRPGREGSGAPKDQKTKAQPAQSSTGDAGDCSTCHINVVLEWGVSAHSTKGVNCIKCHGASAEHVANEKNEVAPDRLPRSQQIAPFCRSCHSAGCPKTAEPASCQGCHHMHALVDPKTDEEQIRSTQRNELEALEREQARYKEAMHEGNLLVKTEKWEESRHSFERALKLRPGDGAAESRLAFIRRRVSPKLSGFRQTTGEFDSDSGLPLRVEVEGLGIAMILAPAGEFEMGEERLRDARPVHTVAVRPFYLGRFEITQPQWREVMGANPSMHQGDRFRDTAHMPIEQVSWNDCQVFVERLNARIPGGGFRLPTEAEWEYAGRAGAGSTSAQPQELDKVAWYQDNSRLDPRLSEPSFSADDYAPRPVGKKKPNPWGFYDMLGNVWEWCADLYRPYLSEAPPGLAHGHVEARTAETRRRPAGLRILRGGAYADPLSLINPAFRYADRPTHAFRWVGVRLARSVPVPE